MADIDEDDGFIDDDLDAFTSDDFLELQQQAIRSTQRPDYSVPSSANVSLRPKNLPIGRKDAAGQTPPHPSSDYGDLDEEVFDAGLLDDPQTFLAGRQVGDTTVNVGEISLREQWRHQRYSGLAQLQNVGQQRQGFQARPGHDLSHNTHARNNQVAERKFAEDSNGMFEDSDMQVLDSKHAQQLDPSRNLEAKVTELLRERESLQQALRLEQDRVNSKAGEISIIRANQAKAQKEHERQLKDLSKQHADITAKQRAEIEHARAEREKLLTEKTYLQHDLREEAERTKRLQRQAKSGITGKEALNSKGHITTPKKPASLPFRDGFDDNEIMVISPTKPQGRSRTVTPKAEKKRKFHPTEESPGQSFDANHLEQLPDGPISTDAHRSKVAEKEIIRKPDQRFQFYQKLLNHRIALNEQRSVEALAAYAFPSKPDTMLSTLFLDKMALLGASQNTADYCASVASAIVGLWAECVNEEYYKPLRLLLDLVEFILMNSPFSAGPRLMDEAVPLAQKTADINVIPRFNRFARATTNGAKRDLKINNEVNTKNCLGILYLIAGSCSRKKEDISRFWRLMRFDFIMMVCRNTQPLEDVNMMLKLLKTSVQENTIFMISNPAKQAEWQQHVIDRISAMLIEVPRATEGEEPHDVVDTARMRLEVLSLLEKLCDKRHGGEALAKHPLAIGRLVRLISDELNALYDNDVGHEERSALINQATRLLYHLTSAYSDSINMQEKLRAHPGGAYKHLIALTRLAFSEGVYYEKGIEDDVVDCAHQMLEDTITPEEGEALFEVFSSAKK